MSTEDIEQLVADFEALSEHLPLAAGMRERVSQGLRRMAEADLLAAERSLDEITAAVKTLADLGGRPDLAPRPKLFRVCRPGTPVRRMLGERPHGLDPIVTFDPPCEFTQIRRDAVSDAVLLQWEMSTADVYWVPGYVLRTCLTRLR